MQQAPQSPSRGKRILIAGVGETGSALARALSGTWEITAVDRDEAQLARLHAHLPSLRTLAADATSLLNLRAAGVEGAAWLAALTDDDEVNIEICRIALSLPQPPAAIGIAHRADSVDRLKMLGAEAILRPGSIAALVANQIDRGMRIAVSVGLGEGEVVEIPVLDSSPAAGVRVADLHARGWLIAAIYREAKILIPHGDARIQRGDRLLLTGDPSTLPSVANWLRAGAPRFPQQFGSTLLVVQGQSASEDFWRDVSALAQRSRASTVRVLLPSGDRLPPFEGSLPFEATPLSAPLTAALLAGLGPGVGCLILPRPPSSWLSRIGAVNPPYLPLLEALPCPALLAAGTAPYERILLPITDATLISPAAELAFDLARQLGLPVTAIAVSPPSFVAGDAALEDPRRALQSVHHAAGLYGVPFEAAHREGNPVREIARFAAPSDLMVIARSAGRKPSLFRPDTSTLVLQHVPCSVLCLSIQGRKHAL